MYKIVMIGHLINTIRAVKGYIKCERELVELHNEHRGCVSALSNMWLF